MSLLDADDLEGAREKRKSLAVSKQCIKIIIAVVALGIMWAASPAFLVLWLAAVGLVTVLFGGNFIVNLFVSYFATSVLIWAGMTYYEKKDRRKSK